MKALLTMIYQVRHQFIATLAIVVVLVTVAACTAEGSLEDSVISGPSEPLYIKGDLAQWLNVSEVWHEVTLVAVPSVEGTETINGVALNELLDLGEKLYPNNDLYLMADDGFMIRLDDTTVEDTYITYVASKGWCYLSEKHPVNSKIKRIRQIVVAAKDSELVELNDRGLGFNVIKEGVNTWYTRGQLLAMQNEIISVTDGFSSLEGVEIEVMKQHQGVGLDDLIKGEFTYLMLASEDGDQQYLTSLDGIIEVSETFLTYIDRGSHDLTHQVIGAMVDPPQYSNMDHYNDTTHYLSKDVPVLTLFLDGFSYEEYLRVKQIKPSYYLASVKDVYEAISVYKPVTNAGFSAMITGALPPVSGIHDRSDREPKVETVFDYAEKLGKKHLLVEGDIGILNLNTETLINLDENSNGTTDDEIFETAMVHIGQGYDYMMVHFHSIDDFGHSYGPYNEATMEQIGLVDGYVKTLIDQWQGIIIITADHGMHPNAGAGDHGLMVAEDMRVPYMVIDTRH